MRPAFRNKNHNTPLTMNSILPLATCFGPEPSGPADHRANG
ncbi:MAG TPA: hypothetical protein VMP01_02265 [Pirellulaceae bacterium]|nr:hypothetical protein [Pirellulaceae bacterium]